MKVAVLHGCLSQETPKDEQDVLREAEAVSQALGMLGYEPVAVPISLNLQAVIHILQTIQPAFVFNLVESVAGEGQFIHAGPMVLDYLNLPYTGATTAAMFVTSNKLLAKKIFQTAGIPTPPWLSMERAAWDEVAFAGPYIIKSVWEHASIGLDDEAVIREKYLLKSALKRRCHHFGGQWFVEQYVTGREFNLSLLAGPQGPELLSPAEIEFRDYPAGKAKIVSYQAKWEEESFEYRHTQRRFDFPSEDETLLSQLADIARACWSIFDLRGYARVDFRVDHAGQPWVLEVNANPCIAPDSGFVAAADRAGVDFRQVVQRIIADALSSPHRSGVMPGALSSQSQSRSAANRLRGKQKALSASQSRKNGKHILP